MFRTSSKISIIAFSIAGGCTSVINQNTDGNQVYTGMESGEQPYTDGTTGAYTAGDFTTATTMTEKETETGNPAPGSSSTEVDASDATGGDTDSSTTTGGTDTGQETGDTGLPPLDDDPITDPPGPIYAVSLALGWGSTYALLNTGEIKAWGTGVGGRLGYGNEADVIDPGSVGAIDLGFRAKQVVAGRDFACALAADDEPEAGSARCWGIDAVGNLGRGFIDVKNPNIGDDEVPADVPLIQLDAPIVALAAGWMHTCALRKDHQVTCWGRGGQGQLGYGKSENVGDDEPPGAKGTVDVGWPVTTMWAGGQETCLGNALGAVICFGEGKALGNATTDNIGDDELPKDQPVLSFGFPIRQLAIGTEHMCALATAEAGGQLACVGLGEYGRLGRGNVENLFGAMTAQPVALPGPLVWVDASHAHTCGNLEDGRTACFGWGSSGNLGYASTEHIGDDEPPTEWGTVVTGIDAVRVYTGVQHTCALDAEASIVCWGAGYIGYPDIWWGVGDDEVPASVGLVPYL